MAEVRRRRYRIVRRVLRWARANLRDYPWRRAGTTSYEVMIAELLLKRTTSTAAARVYPMFIDRFPSFAAVAEASPQYLEDTLQSVGLQKQRAVGLKQMAAHVGSVHGGSLPRGVELLEKIPHAGPYAARAVASFAHQDTAAVVDSNVERIVSRLFFNSLPGRVSLGTFQEIADALVPPRQHRLFNYALLDLGATVCRYVRPRCPECPLAPVCDSALP